MIISRGYIGEMREEKRDSQRVISLRPLERSYICNGQWMPFKI